MESDQVDSGHSIRIRRLSDPILQEKLVVFLKGKKTIDLLNLNLDDEDIVKQTSQTIKVIKMRAQVMTNMKLTQLRSIERFTNVSLPKDQLVYQGRRWKHLEGYYIVSDDSMKGGKDPDNERFIMIYGQVKPFSVRWKWLIPWEQATEKLRSKLSSVNEIGFQHLSYPLRRGILDHFVFEFFIYFRKSIPTRYLDAVLSIFIVDYPSMNDGSSSGFHIIGKAVKSFFRSFVEHQTRKKGVKREMIDDSDQVQMTESGVMARIDFMQLRNQNKLQENLDQVNGIRETDCRYNEFIDELNSFVALFEKKRKRPFGQRYRHIKYEINLAAVALHILMTELELGNLIFGPNENTPETGFSIRISESETLEKLCHGSMVKGSLYYGSVLLYKDVGFDQCIYNLIAIHLLFDLPYPSSYKHFFTFIEICIMNLTLKQHTGKTCKLKRDLNKR